MTQRPRFGLEWASTVRSLILAGASLIMLLSCGDISEQADSSDGSSDAGVQADHTRVGSEGQPAPSADRFAQGEAVFNQLCTACHTTQPPPNLAPPMMGISGHYHEAFDDRAEAIAAITEWVVRPSPEKSVLPAMAIERFGLMAPLPLPDSSLQAVAAWVWDMYDPEDDPHAEGDMGGMQDIDTSDPAHMRGPGDGDMPASGRRGGRGGPGGF